MNEKHKAGYYKWDTEKSILGMSREHLKKAGWKGACEFMQKEIDGLKLVLKRVEEEMLTAEEFDQLVKDVEESSSGYCGGSPDADACDERVEKLRKKLFGARVESTGKFKD